MKKILLFLMFALFCIPWAANAQETLLVHDGTTTNQYVPFYGYYADEDQQNQMIYPATELTDMAGAEITQMVFHYFSLGSGGTGVGTWTVSLGETRNTTLSGLDNSTTLTEVFTGGLDALFNTTDQTLTITFDNGYTYQGGNLLVEFSHEASGWRQCYFYGETVTGASYCYGGQRNFLPKTTFTYEPASNCAKPTNLAVNYTSGATNATVTWSGDARSYNIDVNGIVTNDVTSPYTLGNLTPNTTYTIKVQSDCGDEQSGWASAGSFTTPCGTYAIPYAYGFEDENDMTCWSMVNIPSGCEGITGLQTNAWAEYNFGDDYARNGNNFFFFYYYAYSSEGAPFQTLISPELSGISNGLHVVFYYRGYDNGIETFKVGYSTTDNDPDSFIWGNEITASSSYQRFSANYPAGTKYVAVQHTSDDQYYLFLDDFLFEESANCLEPSGVQVADVTTTGATISWTAGGEETAWDIFVTDDATVEPDETTTPTVAGTEANPYSLTDLDPATIYYVYVRAICGEDEVSAWSSPAIFNTECIAMVLPYSYGFEDATLPVCWNTIIENTSYTGINLMAISETDQVLTFYMGTSQNPALVAVLPEVDETYPLNGYQITFDACYANPSGGSSMTSGKLGIGIMTDPTDFTTFTPIEEVNITVGYSSFGTYNVWLNTYTGNGRYIAIRDIYTQNGYVLVDNIEVTELPACLQPTNLTVEGGKNAVVTWEGDAESFDIAYSTDNTVDPADNIVDNTTGNTFNLGEAVNLTEGDYYVWVRANCGTDGYSDWTSPVSFHVGFCTPNPTSHDGSGITGVSFGTGDYVVTNGDGSASLPASAPFYGDYTSMIGAVQAGVESTIAITTGTNTWPYTFVIWVDLDNSMSFEDNDILYIGKASSGNGTLNATITIPATQATGDYRMRIYGADSYFTSFYGNGTTNWDADHDPCSSGSYRHAHDYTLRVLEAPSCLPAGDVTVAPESITSTSAVISWTNYNGDEATYTVMQGENVLTTTAVDSYTLTLTASTNYPTGTFTIISDCDETMIANVPAFTTLCDDITNFPWSEDFEGFSNNTVPMCWDNSASTSLAAGTSQDYYIWGVVTVNGNNMIKMENYWAKTGTALINTPTIELPAEGAYQLSFDYAHNATCGAFAVNVSTDNGTTFTELASYTKGSGSSHTEPGDFTPATISLADYAGESIILQFFANANYDNGAIFVDNVAVTEIAPACELALDAVESFETYTESTELWTGAFPACWTIAHNYTTHASDSVAVIYRSFKTDGYYSLRLNYRGIVAMPALALPADVDINHVKLNMNVRQAQTYYSLQVGVMTDLDDESTFVPVALCNNPTKEKLPFECNFASYVVPENYEGPFYIAFKNIGVAATDPHSVNYLDEVVVSTFEDEEVPACAITQLAYTEFFNELSVADDGRLVPACWTLPEEFNNIPTNNKPQLYNSFAHTGNYSLKMRDLCVYAMPKYAVTSTPITNVKMTFWLRQAKKSYQLEVGVMTNANDASTFIPVQTIDNETTGKEEVTVLFNTYTGPTEGDLYIAFRNKGNTSAWTYSYNYIDDITLVDVTAQSGSKIAETADGEVFDTDRYLESIAVYPNPTTGVLHIDAVDVQKVECYNQMGQLVGVYDHADELNISELSNGVYMLRITVPQGVTMRKVVKK